MIVYLDIKIILNRAMGNFLARVFVLWVGFSSFAGGAKQVFKMRNFFYAF